MNNLETLKQELISQKELIEKRGGAVVVTGTNPSPAEITEGIKTISGNDLTVATATPEDVKAGKTFYALTPGLKTGTASFDPEVANHLFNTTSNVARCEDDIYYTIPSYVTKVKDYLFQYNANKVHITFHSDIVTIGERAFQNTSNFVFTNFSELQNLTTIYNYAFKDSGCEGIDFGQLPDNIQAIYSYAFDGAFNEYQDLKIPSNIYQIGESAFRNSTRKVAGTFDVSGVTHLPSFPSYMCYYIAFNSDLIIPTCVKSVYAYFNYNGSFNNIFIPTETKISACAFHAIGSLPLSDFNLKTVVFEAETPAAHGSNIFAYQHINNGFKIYVPDNSVEAYKALSGFSSVVDCIYPISEKD